MLHAQREMDDVRRVPTLSGKQNVFQNGDIIPVDRLSQIEEPSALQI